MSRRRKAAAYAILAPLLAATLMLAGNGGHAAITYKKSEGAVYPEEAQSQSVCELRRHRVWVKTEHGSECIAYYPTEGLDGAEHAVLYFDGDVPAELQADKPLLARILAGAMRLMQRHAAEYKVPYVYVARPGVFGSSGDHGLSKRTQEYYTLNAAIDAIKARHRIARVSLAGQSGGSSAIAAILTLGRTDVVCAAPASGSFAVFERLDRLMTKAGRPLIHRMSPERYTDLYDVMRHLRHIKPAPERRILVIGDPKDQVTPFDLQQRFADGLRALNHHALLIEGEARDPEHHGLGHIAMKLAGACAAGIKDEELARLARTP